LSGYTGQTSHNGFDEAILARVLARHVASASLSELDTTYLGSELIAVTMGLAGSV